ncbi:MAG: sodium-dependent transporter, partial [Clostridiales bacterium]
AALTSAISLMEAVVATVCDEFKLPRNKAAILSAILIILLGIPSSLGFGILGDWTIMGLTILDQFDFITNSVLMPITALLTCIFVGYVIKPEAIIEEVKLSSDFKREKVFTIMIKYIGPIFILAILISSVLDNLGIAKI